MRMRELTLHFSRESKFNEQIEKEYAVFASFGFDYSYEDFSDFKENLYRLTTSFNILSLHPAQRTAGK